MALKIERKEKLISFKSVEYLKLTLTKRQRRIAKEMFHDIQQSFHESGVTITKEDTRLIELIKYKILDYHLAEKF